MSPRRWLILIIATAAILRLFPIWFGLPYGFARPDEEVSTTVPTRMLEGTFNPQFFHWPSFTFDLFAILYGLASVPRRLITGEAALSYREKVIIGRVAVACFGTATVGIVYALGRRVANQATGLMAAAILAVALLHVRESHFAMADVLMTFWLTLSLVLLLRGIDDTAAERALKWYAASGFAGGLAASTKYNAAAVVVAMGAAQVVIIGRSLHRVVSLRAWLPSIVFVAACAAGFLVATPYALLDYANFRIGLQEISTHLSGGHGINLGRGWVYHFKYSLPFGLGLTAFALSLIGIVPFIRRYPRYAWILGSFTVVVYAVIGSGYAVFFRYILPIVPILCVSAAVGIEWLTKVLTIHVGLSRRAALTTLLVVTLTPGLIASVWLDLLLARTDTRVIAARWLVERLQPEDTLYDGGGVYVGLDLHDARFHQWYFDRVTSSFGHPEGKNPDWIVLYESPLLMYAQSPIAAVDLAGREYVLVHSVRATRRSARSAVYDQHDAFFMPMWGFWTVERPGPTIRIYRRRDLSGSCASQINVPAV